jgi:hypothetical protein
MNSPEGKATVERSAPRRQVNRPAATSNAPPTISGAFPVSAIALAAALLAASPQLARASECGVDGGGQDTLTCDGVSYLSGITYMGSGGLTLNLDNSAMVVSGTQGVTLGSASANMTVNVMDVNSITASGKASTVSASAGAGRS